MIIAVGAKSSRGLGLPGENGPDVIGGVDLLRAVSLSEGIDIGREIVVIGGGNVAYDVANATVKRCVTRIRRLYEQERRRPFQSSPLGVYVSRWWRWAGGGLPELGPLTSPIVPSIAGQA